MEDVDYVVCLTCSAQYQALNGHLKRKHGISADEYRRLYPGASVYSQKASEARTELCRKVAAARDNSGTKTVQCPSCEAFHEVPKHFVPSTHDARCPTCKDLEAQASVKVGVVGQDYVTCLECGHSAVNLTSHLMSAHNIHAYRQKYPAALINAQSSGVRDKSKIRGRHHSPETLEKMRQGGGWSRGLTAESGDVRMVARRDGIRRGFQNGRVAWAKGHTAETHPSLKATSEKLKRYVGPSRPWDNGLKVVLTSDQLLKYAYKNGKVHLERACKALGISHPTVKRECVRLCLPYASTLGEQVKCLGMVSKVLGGLEYLVEWRTMAFLNPNTGHRFRFDGYFPDVRLIVEYHGYQHFVFPNRYHTSKAEFDDQQDRDDLKRKAVLKDPTFQYLEIRFDDPYEDWEWAKKRVGLPLNSTR